MYIGEKIRKERGISRQRLSELSGVPYRTLDNYEKKINRLDSVAILKKVANALDVKIDDLFEWDDEERS